MRKISPTQLFMLTLPRLIIFAVFLISGGAEVLLLETTTAFAAPVPETVSTVTTTTDQTATGCRGERRGPSFNSTMVVSSGEVICGNMTSFSGSMVIRGEVHGDVVAFGGDVVIAGTVFGNVALYGGNLTLQDGAQVNGDIHVCGGTWTEGAASQLHGTLVSCTKSVWALLTNDSGANFHFWSIIIWVVLGMLLTSLLPEHVMLVRTTVKSKTRRSFVLGLLTILLAPAILAVLIALIISIPLAILVVVGIIAAWALGMVAIGWHVGDIILRKFAPQYNTRLTQVMVGMAILGLVSSLPFFGLLISIGIGLLGLGAVFLSRFGTRLYAPPKQPLPL